MHLIPKPHSSPNKQKNKTKQNKNKNKTKTKTKIKTKNSKPHIVNSITSVGYISWNIESFSTYLFG